MIMKMMLFMMTTMTTIMTRVHYIIVSFSCLEACIRLSKFWLSDRSGVHASSILSILWVHTSAGPFLGRGLQRYSNSIKLHIHYFTQEILEASQCPTTFITKLVSCRHFLGMDVTGWSIQQPGWLVRARCFGVICSKPWLVVLNIIYGCFQKSGYPKMDGENNGKPIKMDDLGVPLFAETSIWRFSKANIRIPK